MKMILVVLVLISASAVDAVESSSFGHYVCDMVFDKITTLTDKLNTTCDPNKPFSVTSAIRSTGSIAITYCCISKK